MSDFWTANPAYQEYKEARWRRDYAHAAKLVAEGVAGPEPVERAHWLVAKASLHLDFVDLPAHVRMAWDYLEQAVELMPDHGGLLRGAFRVALSAIGSEGPVDRWIAFLARLGPNLADLVREPSCRYNIGALRFSGGQWRQAVLWFDRAFADGYVSSGGAAGHAVPLSTRARALSRLGRLAEARADLDEACRLFEHHGHGRPRHGGISMAEAEIALAGRQFRQARIVLQTNVVGSPFLRHPSSSVHANLLAAELALAEGNREGYGHYCDLALTTCQEHNLTISAHYVRTVMAQAERRYAGSNSASPVE